MYRVILASESPRRKEIMDIMGMTYETMPANVLEVVTETNPAEMVQALAAKKAKYIAAKMDKSQGEYIIIGADTMVFYQGHALGKPKDSEDAIQMLSMLSGHIHEVITGVYIIIRSKDADRDISFAVSTKVTVQPLTLEQIGDYVATGEPLDKAGAYAIQGKFGIFIKEIAGDYYNIVGFPIAKIYEKLLEEGI
ncbi:MAG TPA: Maf family protein, partial [Mobilitalea sp.]|nr:Maf family protein [Mobilitalea sp.]